MKMTEFSQFPQARDSQFFFCFPICFLLLKISIHFQKTWRQKYSWKWRSRPLKGKKWWKWNTWRSNSNYLIAGYILTIFSTGTKFWVSTISIDNRVLSSEGAERVWKKSERVWIKTERRLRISIAVISYSGKTRISFMFQIS